MPFAHEPTDPDVMVGELKLWVHDYERPDRHDSGDGNWLHVTARYEGRGALVEASGSFLRTDELSAFLEECRAMHKTLAGQACLDTMEENPQVRLVASDKGHVAVETSITPDQTQQHRFRQDIDQTHLPEIVRGLTSVLQRFPVRGQPPRSSKQQLHGGDLRGSVVREGDIVSPIDKRRKKHS